MDEKFMEQAQRLEEDQRALALSRMKPVAQESDPHFDGSACLKCGEDIPPARLALGKIRCTTCQQILEKRR